jgi:hypothetical protein
MIDSIINANPTAAELRSSTCVRVPILLGACDPQSGQPMSVHRVLPGKEFVNGEQVSGACLLKREQPTAYGHDDLGLAAYHPPRCARRW